MPERLAVSSIESAVILINEVFSNPRAPKENQCGHYSEAVAKNLHQNNWRHWYHPELDPLAPAQFLQDVQRGQLLLDSVNQILETLTPQERRAIRIRFGFDNGEIQTLDKVAEALSLTSRERPRQIIAKAERKLRHPARSKFLKPFLL